MRILVCGSRYWADYEMIFEALADYAKETVVIHGAARGADSLGGRAAKELGMSVLEFPAEWEKYGKSAGPIRNQQMLDEGKPELVLAFHENLEVSKGTKDMIRRARKRGLPVVLYTTPNTSTS